MADTVCPKCGPGTTIYRVPGKRTATCIKCGVGRHITQFRPAGGAPPVGSSTLRDVWPIADQPRPGGKRSFEKRP